MVCCSHQGAALEAEEEAAAWPVAAGAQVGCKNPLGPSFGVMSAGKLLSLHPVRTLSYRGLVLPLPYGELGESPSLEVCKNHVDVVLGNVGEW